MKVTKLQENIFECLEQGLKTKEIVEKLGCSVDSVKQTRANKALKELYEKNKKQSTESRLLSAVDLAIEKTAAALENPNLNADTVIALGKQIFELSEMRKEIKPREDIIFRVVYPELQQWQIDEKKKLAEEGLIELDEHGNIL